MVSSSLFPLKIELPLIPMSYLIFSFLYLKITPNKCLRQKFCENRQKLKWIYVRC